MQIPLSRLVSSKGQTVDYDCLNEEKPIDFYALEGQSRANEGIMCGAESVEMDQISY